MNSLPRSFYNRKTTAVAKDLLGKILVRHIGKTIISGRIVETEAYLFDDPASHSFRGMTKRNRVMFGPPGFLYVYFTYGLHYCANVVTRKNGIGEAVLIRAVEPIDGISTMVKNRTKKTYLKSGLHLRNLTNGPAKLTQAFGLTTIHSGTDLLGTNIFITNGDAVPRSKIIRTTRIGISIAKEELLRFYIKDNSWVSKR
jgi:DNA-3-methyladenine glycosylase